jgi:hypothetical protein
MYGDRRNQTSVQSWPRSSSQDSGNQPGRILINMLVRRAQELGHDMEDMAHSLDTTVGHIALLRAGVLIEACNTDPFIAACASYLGVSESAVLIALGQVSPLDAFENRASLAAMLSHAIRRIDRDDRYGALMPREVYQASPDLQLLLVTLFEAATGQELLGKRVIPEETAKLKTANNANAIDPVPNIGHSLLTRRDKANPSAPASKPALVRRLPDITDGAPVVSRRSSPRAPARTRPRSSRGRSSL